MDHFYTPSTSGSATILINLEVKVDGSVRATTEDPCTGEIVEYTYTWAALDSQTIRILPTAEDEANEKWFFESSNARDITLSRSDEQDLVDIRTSKAPHIFDPPYGFYRRGYGCFSLEEPDLGCVEGAWAVQCPPGE